MIEKKKAAKPTGDLAEDIRSLKAAIEELTHYERLGISMFYSLIKGVAYGLGALLAVAIVVPIVIWSLSSISWPPKIAGFVDQVILHMQQAGHNAGY